MGKRYPVIIAYDITDNKVRYRVFKILKTWRIDGQKSVHECLLTRSEAEELFLQLAAEVDVRTDLLMMARLEQHRRVLGRGLGKSRFIPKIIHYR